MGHQSKFEVETLSVEKQEELIAEFEPESKFRNLTGIARRVSIALCLILSLFHIYTAGFGVLQEYEHRAFHLSFVLCLIFLCYTIRRKEPPRRKSIVQSTIYGILG
ncbi:TRAP transporter permease, partial [bacterium]|nr:TRAP transporter permease [bacterium]